MANFEEGVVPFADVSQNLRHPRTSLSHPVL
jgi:hypothetical protein